MPFKQLSHFKSDTMRESTSGIETFIGTGRSTSKRFCPELQNDLAR